MMKKILTVAIALAVSVSAFAQSSFSLGIGETIRHRMGNNEMATNSLSQMQSGLMVEATYANNFTDIIGITAGLRYSFEGIYNKKSMDLKLLGIRSEAKWLNSYLELPINVKFNLTPDSNVNFFVAAGPTLSLWATNTLKQYTEVVSPEGKSNVTRTNLFDKVKDYYNKFNVGAGLTLGIEIIEAIRVTVGYDYYFLDGINKDVTGAGTLKNGQGRIGVAYIF